MSLWLSLRPFGHNLRISKRIPRPALPAQGVNVPFTTYDQFWHGAITFAPFALGFFSASRPDLVTPLNAGDWVVGGMLWIAFCTTWTKPDRYFWISMMLTNAAFAWGFMR